MARFLQIFSLLLLNGNIFICYSQINFVPNHSFEDTLKCIQHDDQFTGYVADWTCQQGGGGVCLFTSQCSGPSYDVSVPKNIMGFQYAHSGVSYAGIYTFISDTCDYPYDTGFHNFRNYIETKIFSPLTNGTKYYVTFYVNCASYNYYACSDIGAYLSDSALKFDTVTEGRDVKSYITPQIANNPITEPLTDTTNWQKITGTYIASGGEQYIIIGNFKNDSNSHIKFLGGSNRCGSYYYIDDVFVTTDSALAGASEVKVESEKVKVFPNPASTMLNVEIQNNSEQDNFCLYNEFGQLIECVRMNNNFNTLSVSNLAEGLYYYRIADYNGDIIKSDKIAIMH
jgi:hypothetical protein